MVSIDINDLSNKQMSLIKTVDLTLAIEYLATQVCGS